MERNIVPEIVNIFIDDPIAYLRRRELYDYLKLIPTDFVTIENKNPYNFFKDLFDMWTSKTGQEATLSALWKICDGNGFKKIADDLQEKYPHELSKVSKQLNIDDEPVAFEVNDEVWNFIGRSEELKTLHALFHGNTEYVVTITGMGGIGKSELAKRFAHELLKQRQITIIWFNGQDRETLADSVDRLSQLYGIVQNGPMQKNIQRTFLATVSAMPSKMKKRKLVIVDNVDEANEGAVSLIKAKIPDKDCFFLVTSRNLKVLNFAGEIIRLNIFPDEDANALVFASLKGETNKDIADLCKLLQNFPLALQQAVAYIREEKFTSSYGDSYKISNYIQGFESKKQEYLNYELNLEHDYELTTLVTWNVTMDKIRNNRDVGGLAFDILCCIAYFEPDRIDRDLLQHFFKDGDIEKAVKLIKTYSLVKSETKVISIHRLLQQVIQLNVFGTKELEVQQLRKMMHTIIEILEEGEKKVVSSLSRFILEQEYSSIALILENKLMLNTIRLSYFLHIQSVWNKICRYQELVVEFKSIPVKIIDVVQPIRIDFCTKDDDLTHDFIRTNYSLFMNLFGSASEETLELQTEISCMEPQLSSNEIIINQNMTVADIYRRRTVLLEEGNLSSLRALEKLIYCIVHEGRYLGGMGSLSEDMIQQNPKLAKYCKDFLKLSENKWGPNHESTRQIRWILIQCLGETEPEVLDLYNELLDDAQAFLGEEHYETLTIMAGFATALFRQNKLDKAKDVIRRYLSADQGECIMIPNSARFDVSFALYCLGDRERAFKILEFTQGNIAVGSTDLMITRSKCDSADELVAKSDYAKAATAYKRILVDVVDMVSSTSKRPSCSSSRWWEYELHRKYASCLNELCNFEDAIRIFEDVSQYWEENAGKDHKFTIETKELLQIASNRRDKRN